MIERLKLDAEFFNLRGLKEELARARPPGLDDVIEIDCRGTRVCTMKRVLAKGKTYPVSYFKLFAKMFDLDCKEYLTPESDGSVKIDSHPALIQNLVSLLECESQERRDRVMAEFWEKYDGKVGKQWEREFDNKYRRVASEKPTAKKLTV